ncbi:MAG: hypothetical protein ACK5ZP_01865 [Betaproteobacteria bacterium]
MFKLVTYVLVMLTTIVGILSISVGIWIDITTNNFGENTVDEWPYKKLRAKKILSKKQVLFVKVTHFLRYVFIIIAFLWLFLYLNR